MSTLPASLRRVLDAQKPKPAPAPGRFVPPEPRYEVTTIWKDGEIWRETADGKARQLPSIRTLS